ncbi:MAG TPA: BON domain-containing protein [Acidobacteriaceae bacterium]|nr:BON domain-containing protein [Acidobacteriaceae bacterium]
MNRTLLLSLTTAIPLATALAQSTDSLQSAVEKALRPAVWSGVPSTFKDIHASVLNGVVTLTGSVNIYSTKFDAERAVSRIAGVRGIQDDIQVAGPEVSDALLQSRIEHRVRTKAISVTVHNGVVDLVGQHVDPLSASAALSTAANTPGVQGIVDRISVTPWGPEVGSMPYTVSSLP